jgi:uncharacterized protein YbjT (DUF2867 family)
VSAAAIGPPPTAGPARTLGPGETRRALIAGATGLVGGRVLTRLRASPAYREVHALVRRPLPAALRESVAAGAPVDEHVVDFGALARLPAFPQVDDVYCCLGTTIRAAGSRRGFRDVDFDAVVALARIARRHGASRLAFVSAMGADPDSPLFYNRVKGDAEAALAKLGYASLTLLRPSLLDGARTEWRTGERIALALGRPVAGLIPARWRPVRADAVAACMVESVLRGTPGLRVVESDRIALSGAGGSVDASQR